MVSLVIVSHSRPLATAVADLVKSLTTDTLPVAVAGGVGENYAELGTDATDIMEAIESVYSDDGVLVLVDMGSAILSTELALEFLDETQVQNIKITAAPVIEGAVAAAVQMQLNAPLESVYAEAMAGLLPKQTHLNEVTDTPPQSSEADNKIGIAQLAQSQQAKRRDFVIQNPHGLHARPAATLAQAVAPFSCQIGVQNISKQSDVVDMRSVLSLSCLQLLKGETMAVFALGEDAEQALDAIADLHNNHYGESFNEDASVAEPTEQQQVISLCEGYALAPAFILNEQPFNIEKRAITAVSAECDKLQHAIQTTISSLRRQAKALSSVEAEILTTHAMLLDDALLFDNSAAIIREAQCAADYAWYGVIQRVAKDYQQMENVYFQQRASDILDIGRQVLAQLGVDTRQRIEVSEPVILFLPELSPSQAAELDPTNIKGVVTARGGKTSHAAIIARSLGIPAVSGFTELAKLKQGDFCMVDGYQAAVYCNPDAALIATYQEKYATWQAKRQQLQQLAQQPARTKDGVSVSVLANIGSLQEAQAVANSGADGVGLLRTEFLFLDNADAPDEETQYQQLREILTAVGKPVTIRTFDIGGDKPVPYVNQAEKNPFLGVRGVRLYSQLPELFESHIRAILRAAAGQQAKIMFPMIASLEDFSKTKQRVETIHEQLTEQGIAHQWPIPIGMMVETPAAALLADEFSQLADFFSIGTNDLTQYLMAADRGDVALAGYNNPLSKPVLDMVQRVIDAAEKPPIPVGLCGDPGTLQQALPTLIHLGLRAISLSLSSIPEAKQIIANVDDVAGARKTLARLNKRC